MKPVNSRSLLLTAMVLVVIQACSLPTAQTTEVSPTVAAVTSPTEAAPIEIPIGILVQQNRSSDTEPIATGTGSRIGAVGCWLLLLIQALRIC